MDAAHFVHGLFLSGLWCVARCWQPTPTGRHRLSVLGALNAIPHELITVTTDAYIHSESVCRLLRQLAALALPVPITVILDNARYQRCRLVQDTAAALKIELLFLPTYSPQFNLIERFWKLVKKCCLHAHSWGMYIRTSGFIGTIRPRSSRRPRRRAVVPRPRVRPKPRPAGRPLGAATARDRLATRDRA